MKFPYGISDFATLRNEGYFYVDRTAAIPALEATGKQLIFLRPRRFGKSLLLSLLENYYDLNKTAQFDTLFGALAIGRNPTPERNRYFVMKWDFSAISTKGDCAEIDQNLKDYLNDRITAFAAYYRDKLACAIQINPHNAHSSLNSLLTAVQQSGHPLYLLLDEYDNFANEVMMGQADPHRHAALLSGEGSLRALFKAIKAAAAGLSLQRVFITGVSPVAMSEMTSAYNIAKNIDGLPRFHELCGFIESEIEPAVRQLIMELGLAEDKVAEAMNLMETFYNGYQFIPRPQSSVYNPTLVLYFLDYLQEQGIFPQKILDTNLAMDRAKMEYIACLPYGRELIFDALAEAEPVAIPRLADRFSVRDMLQAPKEAMFVASLLYYFGVLTLDGFTPFGELRLRIPNLVSRTLYAEQIRAMLLPEGKTEDMAQRAARALCQHGDIQPLCEFVEHHYFKVFSNRDYTWSNELVVKTAFLTLLFNDTLYIMASELETERSHTDLTMLVRPDMRQFQVLDILIEFKFVSLQEAGLSGKQLETLSREKLEALPAVQRKKREARDGLARYQTKLRSQFGDIPRLHCFGVVAVGFERLVFWQEG